jgi:salicylate hydroxylase
MRVAIAGGGIGGLTLARALVERGIEADVYEQAGELREIGAAVALSANGIRELERLGLGRGLAAISTQPSSLCLRRSDGTLSCREPMGERDGYRDAFGSAFYGVHRVPLLKLLAEGLDPDRIHLAHRIADASNDGRLRFENGTDVTADVVVAADGVHSVVRRALGFGGEAVFSGTVGYRGLVPVSELPSLPEPSALRFWAGPGRHLLHYPIGKAAPEMAFERYDAQRRARTTRVQAYSRRAVDLLHVDAERFAERDRAFADLPTDLAWIHGHDARGTAEAARHGSGIGHA